LCAARTAETAAAPEEWFQVLAEEAQRDAELREARLECGVHANRVYETRGGEERGGGALHDGDGDAGDGDDGEERHLEAGVEERVRIEREQAERSEAETVETAAVTIEKAANEIERHHGEGPLHRLAEAGEERIGEGESKRDGGERQAVDAQPAADGEDERREDAEMQAGDDEQVEGTGALEGRAQRAAEIGAVAGDHGGEHSGVVAAEGEEGGQRVWKRTFGELHQPIADGGLQRALEAGEAALVVASADMEFLRFGGADDADALTEHPGGAVPDTGIAVALRRLDRRCYRDEISTPE
jgi:hypothetical protein